MTPPALVLSGGNALGSYHAGAWGVMEDEGVIPNWIVGASIGAVTGAIIAGNPPGQRSKALQHFWRNASSFDVAASFLPSSMRQPARYAQALASRLLGRPSLFTLRPLDLSGVDERPSMFASEPMRRLLTELVDLDRLNNGEIRLTVTAVDLESGEEVVFDTSRGRVELDHVMASSALIPDFPPVEINGRLLVDGGLAANLPIHLVLEEWLAFELNDRPVCFAVDLFPLRAPLPRGVLQAAQRQTDLIFASQTSRTFRAMTMLWRDRAPGADVFLLAHQSLENETAIKSFDFSSGTLSDRSTAGKIDMHRQIDRWRHGVWQSPGLSIRTL